MYRDIQHIRREMKAKTIGYVLTALGLVAGLAWNEAIIAFIQEVIPLGHGTVLAKFIYAVIVTVAVVIVSVYVSRILLRDEEQKP